MKKIKFISLGLVIVMVVGIFAGCGNKNGDNSGGTVGGNSIVETTTLTLKEYLEGGPRVAIFDTSIPDKDSKIDAIILFEDGYAYCKRSFEYGTKPTWGEIAKMSDEELLEYARQNKALESFAGKDPVEGKYCFHIVTDSTGNNVEAEYLEYVDSIYSDETSLFHKSVICCGSTPYTRTATIYDSIFKGFAGNPEHGESNQKNTLYFRTGEDLTITLDNIGDEGVEVD